MLSYSRRGRGSPVVLIHGAFCDRSDMEQTLVPLLAPHHDVYAIDRPGYGDSDRRASGGPWTQAKLVAEFMARLELQDTILVGQSIGAAVALAAGLRCPDRVAGIVVIAPICFPELRMEHLLFGPRATPFIGPFINQSAAFSSDPLMMPMLRSHMFLPHDPPEGDVEAIISKYTRSHQLTRAAGSDALGLWELGPISLRYAEYPVPVTVVADMSDFVVNPAMHAAPLSRLLPRSHLVSVSGQGHMLHHTCQDSIVGAIDDLARHRLPTTVAL